MSRTGEIGRVWSMGRPLVYRALELLEGRGLIRAAGSEPGVRGPNRTLFETTAQGREELIRWLAEPVEHVRDIRSLLLLKLVLIERAGLESAPLLKAQRDLTIPAVSVLEDRLDSSIGTEQVFVRFRLETTRAVVSFIDGVLASAPPAARKRNAARRAGGS
jgi:DNA-binding PadR family transcriptional regulator